MSQAKAPELPLVTDALVAGMRPRGLDRGAVLLIALCSLVWLLDGMIPAMLGPAAPSIASSLNLSRAELGPIFSADLVGQSVGLLLVPLLARWIRHRDVIWIAMIGFGLCQALTGLADGRYTLIALRLLTGFFVGGALPSGLAVVAAGVPAWRRGTALMLLVTGYGLGKALAGTVVGIWGGEAWREIFAGSGLCCLIGAGVVWKWLVAAQVEISREQDPATLRAPLSRMLSPPLLPGTLLFWLLFICSLTINYCLASWLPTLLVGTGRGAQIASFAYSIFAVGGIVATLSFGPLIDRFGGFVSLAVSYAAGAIVLFIIGWNFNALSDVALLIVLALAGFFILGSYGGINAVLADFYLPDVRAVGAGWAKGVGRVGTTIAPVVIGLALTAGVAEKDIMSLFAIPAIICAGTLLIIWRIKLTLSEPGERA